MCDESNIISKFYDNYKEEILVGETIETYQIPLNLQLFLNPKK